MIKRAKRKIPVAKFKRLPKIFSKHFKVGTPLTQQLLPLLSGEQIS